MKRKKIVIAHRGANTFAHENTIEAFKKAIELGADMVEFDVRKTKEGTLIIHHDANVNGVPIKQLTYLEINKIYSEQNIHVPTVEEVIKATKNKIGLDVELKEGGYEKEVVELLLKYLDKNHFIITSFYENTIKVIKKNYPDLRVGLLVGCSLFEYLDNNSLNLRYVKYLLRKYKELFPFGRCRRIGADFIVPHFSLLKLGFLYRAKLNKIPLIVWTVNDIKMADDLLKDNGVEGIITDVVEKIIPLHKGKKY